MKDKLKEIFHTVCCFGIDVSIQQDIPLIEADKKTILRMEPGSRFSFGNPIIVNADPFLFVHNDTLFLFYEEMPFFCQGAHINMMSTTDLKHWTKPVTVIKEEGIHFSFPYVFEDNGKVYMVPETGKDGTVRLYRSTNEDLTQFERLDNLLERECPKDCLIDFADNIIHKKDNKYYLFTSSLYKEGYMLELYISDNLKGPYTLHPSSPLLCSHKYGRNGGAIITKGSKMYRMAQDCSGAYGDNMHIMEIDILTPNAYKEHVYKEKIIPKQLNFHKQGGHQLHFVTYHGKVIVTTDALRDRPFYFVRITNKLLKNLHCKL